MITNKEHYDYLVDMIKLKLWFAFHYKNLFPKEELSDIISKRTMLLSYTTFNDDIIYNSSQCNNKPLWNDILTHISLNKQKHSHYVAFEKDALALLSGYIKGRVARDCDGLKWMLGSDSYNMMNPFKYDLSSNEEYLLFHFENHAYPNSILNDKSTFLAHMAVMVSDAHKQGFKYIAGTTWLNNFRPWLRLFPPQWRENAMEDNADIQGDLGFWGQFISPDLRMQKNVVNRFKKTQQLPYAVNTSFASIEDFQRFLSREAC